MAAGAGGGALGAPWLLLAEDFLGCFALARRGAVRGAGGHLGRVVGVVGMVGFLACLPGLPGRPRRPRGVRAGAARASAARRPPTTFLPPALWSGFWPPRRFCGG